MPGLATFSPFRSIHSAGENSYAANVNPRLILVPRSLGEVECMDISLQLIWLFLLAIPIACVAWTITQEEIFRELREYCVFRSKHGKTLFERKMYYPFTCEYCLSHYVTIFFLFFTEYKLLMSDWRGYVIAGFSLVFVSNVYMSLFGLIRQDISKEKTEIKILKGRSGK